MVGRMERREDNDMLRRDNRQTLAEKKVYEKVPFLKNVFRKRFQKLDNIGKRIYPSLVIPLPPFSPLKKKSQDGKLDEGRYEAPSLSPPLFSPPRDRLCSGFVR